MVCTVLTEFMVTSLFFFLVLFLFCFVGLLLLLLLLVLVVVVVVMIPFLFLFLVLLFLFLLFVVILFYCCLSGDDKCCQGFCVSSRYHILLLFIVKSDADFNCTLNELLLSLFLLVAA